MSAAAEEVNQVDDSVTLPRSAVICAARHFTAAHESAKHNTPMDWAVPCDGCPIAGACRFDWTGTAAPVFDAAGLYPNMFR